ncbi:hypothetical protein EV385_4882 [Krasilnikovia cinnamomea]|uniref:Septum formation initiator n=1 Tax=Krasilnikovia cinnamomea TaxID=349313 RepID=A0A4Q7ZPJ3_9ACTN|nr:hypothetical protein EV385_4882 [Krasilnikovia cinnamomea]
MTVGWFGAAALAVLIGLGAVRVIGDGLTSEAGRPRSEAEVAQTLAARGVPSALSSVPPTVSPEVSSAGETAPGTEPPAADPSVTASATTRVPVAPPTSAGPGSAPAPTATARSFRTRGGTVVARCEAGRAEIVAMSPLTGFAVHERDEGPQVQAEGEFRGTADGHDRVRVRVSCSAGRPVLTERDDD